MSSSAERDDEGRGVTGFFKVGFGRLQDRNRLKGKWNVFVIFVLFFKIT